MKTKQPEDMKQIEKKKPEGEGKKCECRCHLPLVTTHLCPYCFNGCQKLNPLIAPTNDPKQPERGSKWKILCKLGLHKKIIRGPIVLCDYSCNRCDKIGRYIAVPNSPAIYFVWL